MSGRPSELAVMGEDGRFWYARAAESLRSWTRPRGIDFYDACDVLAILSPRVQVARNVALMKAFFAGDGPSGVLPSVQRSLVTWKATGQIRGPKTAAFASALRGDPAAVVVDTWMARAFGFPPHSRRALRAAERRRIVRGIRSVAGYLGWSPAETQAAIWCGKQLELGREPAEMRF